MDVLLHATIISSVVAIAVLVTYVLLFWPVYASWVSTGELMLCLAWLFVIGWTILYFVYGDDVEAPLPFSWLVYTWASLLVYTLYCIAVEFAAKAWRTHRERSPE